MFIGVFVQTGRAQCSQQGPAPTTLGHHNDNMLTTTRGEAGAAAATGQATHCQAPEIHPALETFLMCNDQIICIPHHAPPHFSRHDKGVTQHKQGTHVQKSTTNNREVKLKAYQLWISFPFRLCPEWFWYKAGNENGAFKMWVFNYQRNVRSVGRVLTWRNFLDVKFRIEKTLVMNDLYRGLESVFSSIWLCSRGQRAAAQPAWTRENIKLHCICNPRSSDCSVRCPVSCNEDDIIMTPSSAIAQFLTNLTIFPLTSDTRHCWPSSGFILLALLNIIHNNSIQHPHIISKSGTRTSVIPTFGQIQKIEAEMWTDETRWSFSTHSILNVLLVMQLLGQRKNFWGTKSRFIKSEFLVICAVWRFQRAQVSLCTRLSCII